MSQAVNHPFFLRLLDFGLLDFAMLHHCAIACWGHANQNMGVMIKSLCHCHKLANLFIYLQFFRPCVIEL